MLGSVKIAYAAVASDVLNKTPGLRDLLGKITDNIISPLLGLLFTVSFLIFVYGIVKMIMNAEDSDERTSGKNSILWGVVGMAIMISGYGIIRLISSTLGVEDPFL